MAGRKPERHGHPDGVPVSRPSSGDWVLGGWVPGEWVPDEWVEPLDRVLERSRALGFLGPGSTRTHIENGLAFVDALRGARPDGATGGDRPDRSENEARSDDPARSAEPDPGDHNRDVSVLEDSSSPRRGSRSSSPRPSRTLRILDLGSGGGVPRLIIACVMTDASVVLLDAAERRTSFLVDATEELRLGPRVRVVRGRAEVVARDSEFRGVFDVVTARSFAPPPVTAECAVGFLSGAGARILVSEPPQRGSDPTIDGPDRWPAAPLSELGLRPGPLWRRPGSTIQQLDVIGPCPDLAPRRVGVPSRRPWY